MIANIIFLDGKYLLFEDINKIVVYMKFLGKRIYVLINFFFLIIFYIFSISYIALILFI